VAEKRGGYKCGTENQRPGREYPRTERISAEKRAGDYDDNAIRNTKQGCYAERMIETAVPLKSGIKLNGDTLHLDGITD
jgi:hypothetical protein